ncbi:MAG: GxxExxY protein [Candidatus Cloacimonetes bacterium]|nr:GxxExxY protein [Candidatus Cloacimonadota bacterium]
MKINDISYQIRGAIFDVYNELGPGLLENVYEKAMVHELQTRGLNVQCQVPIEILYKGKPLGMHYKLDMLVENTVVVELKSVETLLPLFKKQLETYLKLSGKPLGILVNFNTNNLNNNIIRIANCPDNQELK